MNQLGKCLLATALTVCIIDKACAASMVTTSDPTSEFRHASSRSGQWSAGPQESYSHVQQHFRLSEPNTYHWAFSDRSESRATLDIEADAFSVFIAEHETNSCDRGGNCTTIFVEDYYQVSTMAARIPLEVPEPQWVQVTIPSESIEGTPFFMMDYFGRSVTYEVDLETGELGIATTMVPRKATENPLDVVAFTEKFWIPAGTHSISLQMRSGFSEPGQLFNASTHINIEFLAVPEPASFTLLAMSTLPLVSRRRNRISQPTQ